MVLQAAQAIGLDRAVSKIDVGGAAQRSDQLASPLAPGGNVEGQITSTVQRLETTDANWQPVERDSSELTASGDRRRIEAGVDAQLGRAAAAGHSQIFEREIEPFALPDEVEISM